MGKAALAHGDSERPERKQSRIKTNARAREKVENPVEDINKGKWRSYHMAQKRALGSGRKMKELTGGQSFTQG